MNRYTAISFLFWLLTSVLPAMARGDKIIPQVADGINTDGTVFRTKIDIMNLGPLDAIDGTKVKLQFFHQNGTPWSIATDKGTASEFPLNLAPFESTRIQTSGAPSLASGYAIIRNIEPDTGFPNFAQDFEVSPSVFYEIRKGSDVIDTVSVPIGQRTMHWQLPVEMDAKNGLLTGTAIVNLSGAANSVTLKLYRASSPVVAAPDASVTLSLDPNAQIAIFLNDSKLFPAISTFKGVLEGVSEQPVAVLSLLQSPTPTGIQYATLAPAYIDSLRRNTNMYLPQGAAIDLDLPVSDYFVVDATTTGQDSAPWDITYTPTTGTTRKFQPASGAQAAIIGVFDAPGFDALTLDALQSKTYSSNAIDMSNGSANLVQGFVFAVKTGLGNYVKVHVIDGLGDDAGTFLNLVMEVYVFK